VGNEQDDETSVEPLPHDHMSSNIPSLGGDGQRLLCLRRL
jgi:hypothetical protein